MYELLGFLKTPGLNVTDEEARQLARECLMQIPGERY